VKYLGYLGQPKPYITPLDESSSYTLPYDITETPIYGSKSLTNMRKNLNKNYEYLLVLDKMK
jgi:hypothetical protein